MSTESQPTADDIIALYQLKVSDGDEARLRDLATQIRTLTRMEHVVDVPDEYKQISKVIKLPHLRDTWQRTASAMLSKQPVVHIDPRTAEDDARRAANIAEKWDYHVMEKMARSLGEDAVMESAKELIRDGESVLKVVHKPDAWANFPQRDKEEDAASYNKKADRYLKGARLPFAWRTVDRLSMVFGDGEYGDDWALEYGEYPKPYLKRKYDLTVATDGALTPENTLGGTPMPEGLLSTSDGRSVKVEYVDEDWLCVIVDGSMIKGYPKKNPYTPHLNYFRAKLPDSESLLYSMLYLMPAVDRAVTMKQNWAILAAYPSPQLRPVPGMLPTMVDAGLSLDAKPPPFVWKPGKTVQSPIGYEFGFVSPPPTGQDLNDMIRLLMTLLEIAGIPSVMRGQMGEGSGYLANQLLAAASMSFKVGLRALGRQFEQALELIHWMIPHVVHQPVYVLVPGATTEGSAEFLGLGPDDKLNLTEAPVSLLGPVTLKFRPALPTDEQANAMIGIQTVNSPKQMLSTKRALERYFQEEDPEGAVDEIYVERALESEPVNSIVIQQALQEAFPELAQQVQPPPHPNPASALVGPNGEPLINQNGSLGAAEMIGGIPSVQGLNTPIQPGRAGMFPGRPGTPTSTGGT